MPPPQPCRSAAPEPTPVAYVPNAPISNSFGLKNSGGGGGGGAITCFEDTIGSPPKVTTAGTRASKAKAIDLFIFVFHMLPDGGHLNLSCKAFSREEIRTVKV